MSSEAELASILDVLYEAPVEPSRWQDFLQLVVRAVKAEAAALLLLDFKDADTSVTRQVGLKPGTIQLYESHYNKLDVWLPVVQRSGDWLGTSQRFVDFGSLRKTEFYNDFLLPCGIPHGIFGLVSTGDSGAVNLSLYRATDAFSEQDLEPVRFLKPHIKRAHRLQSQLAAVRCANTGLQCALDSLNVGVILVGENMWVAALNRAAERLLKENDGLLLRQNKLRANRTDDSANLQKLLGEASLTSAGTGLKAGGVMNVSRRSGFPLHVMVSPIRGLELRGGKPVRAIVFVIDPAWRTQPAPEIIQGLFGLTSAETRLAQLLGDGQTLSQITQILKVSNNTLKSQLASIFQKTNTSRQAQLVRLLTQLSVSQNR
jgi:DNA-binding CsgD family transcriptional regulator